MTLAITLLTAWVLPALTRQWQDRQKARELTALLVAQIGQNTSKALVTSSFITFNRFPSSADASRAGFNQQLFNELDLDWRTSSAQVEAQLLAYFPDDVVVKWRDYSDLVWGTYRLITDNVSVRAETLAELRRELTGHLEAAELERHLEAMERPWWDDRTPRASRARAAYFFVSSAVLQRRTAVIDEILDSHPAGFSTRTRDLFSDLLPVL